MRYLLALDSFKGVMGSLEAAGAVEKGIRRVDPDAAVVKIAVADGGEGMSKAIEETSRDGNLGLCGRIIVDTKDPLGRDMKAAYCILEKRCEAEYVKTAYIDMSAASGLPLLMQDERDPLKTTTYGTGLMILDAVRRGCGKIIVGLGGSATNDAGLGALLPIGLKVRLDDEWISSEAEDASVILKGEVLRRVTGFDCNKLRELLSGIEIIGACDVDNPFCGKDGAVAVFAPQKGATPESSVILEVGMKNLCEIVYRDYGMDLNRIAGSGAAGGMGGMLSALAGAELRRGIDIVLDASGFDRLLDEADIVVTGEGKSDCQTLRWKTPYGVMRRSRDKGKKVCLLAGVVEDKELLMKGGFDCIMNINSGFLKKDEGGADPLEKRVAEERLLRAGMIIGSGKL